MRKIRMSPRSSRSKTGPKSENLSGTTVTGLPCLSYRQKWLGETKDNRLLSLQTNAEGYSEVSNLAYSIGIPLSSFANRPFLAAFQMFLKMSITLCFLHQSLLQIQSICHQGRLTIRPHNALTPWRAERFQQLVADQVLPQRASITLSAIDTWYGPSSSLTQAREYLEDSIKI